MGRSIRSALLAGALAATLASLPGCGEDESCCPSPEPAPNEPITYEISGDFRPFSRELKIDAAGEARAVVEQTGERRRTARFSVEPEELEGIRNNLLAADLDGLTVSEASCFDCPSFDIAYGDERVTGNRTTIPTELVEVFERLDRLVDDGLGQRRTTASS